MRTVLGHSRPTAWTATLAVSALGWLAPLGPAASAAGAQLSPDEFRHAAIHPQLTAEMRERAHADEPLLVLMVLDAQAGLAGVAGRPAAVVDDLRSVAAASQAKVMAELRALARTPGEVEVVNSFWITNMLLVEVPSTSAAVNALAAVPGVDRLVPNFEVSTIEPETTDATITVVGDRTWGIDKIEAHRVWRELGVDGDGVLVATLDTGVDISHPELAGKMVTDDRSDPTYPGGWMEFDGSGSLVSSTPHDSGFHGTHVSGTIHGSQADSDSDVAIGVAPGAEMMHGLVLQGGSGTFAQVTAGMQWAMSPTDADGQPAGEPAEIVNMSLGAPGFHQEMVAPTQALRAAGIFPAFSIGNNCVPPLTTGSPGNVYEAVGVGATDSADDVSGASCGGIVDKSDWPSPPEDWPGSYVKPDLSAPGVNVISSVPGGFYANISGTSMAAPHISGTVALMRAAAPGLLVDEAFDVLAETSFFDDRYGAERPNPRYGHGRINAYEATVEAMNLVSGITGTVTDIETDAPIAAATVTVHGAGRIDSTADGTYHVRLAPGTYDLTAEAFGYTPATISDVEVADGTITTADIAMQALPAGRVSGTVALASSDLGVPGARVRVDGTPVAVNTDTGGRYSFDLPVGTWTVRADAHGFPIPEAATVTVTEDGASIADFALGEPLLRAAVLGDDATQILGFLTDRGIVAEHVDWSDDPARYPVVVVNNPADPGPDGVETFLAAADDAGTGLVFLDSWATPPLLTGVNVLVTHKDNPMSRGQAWSTSYRELFYEVAAEHPILDGYQAGDRIVHDGQPQSWKVHAWFDGYTGEGTQVIATAGNDRDGVLGGGIAVAERPNNRHALLSMHAATPSGGPLDWSDATGTLLLNALEWVKRDPGEQTPVFVDHNLRVDSAVVPRGQAVTVSVDVTNVGTAAGSHESVLRVDGETEATAPLSLSPGETATASWSVSRDELDTYQLGVDELRASFRVRGPLVDVTARTLDGPGRTAGPMADAAVDLLYDGKLQAVGTTDEDGRLIFEAPRADDEYTLVLRRAATGDDDAAYLLQWHERIDDDTSITFAPQAPRDDGDVPDDWNKSAVVELELSRVTGGHRAWTYLRSELTAPYGFAVAPGPLVATAGEYAAAHVHAVLGAERDWWYASSILPGLDWRQPAEYRHDFGGPAVATLGVSPGDGTAFTADWAVTDAAGNPFDVVASTELRMFGDVPPSAVLEDVTDLVRARAAVQGEAIITVTDPEGRPVHDGATTWGEHSVTRDLADLVDEVGPGSYELGLDVDTGPYAPGGVTAGATLAGAPLRWLSTTTIEPGRRVDVTAAFTARSAGLATLDEAIGSAADARQPIGGDWRVTGWSASTEATYDGRGRWTFPNVAAAEDVTLTYTMTAPYDVATPSEWTLTGALTLPDGEVRALGGAASLTVAERPVEHGSITGTVTDRHGKKKELAGATVVANPAGTTVVTDDDGSYTMTLIPGRYDLTISAFGYADATVSGVVVKEGKSAEADVRMNALPAGTIAGTARFADSGRGLPGALVAVAGTPLRTTTDAEGRYEIRDVPAGDYQVVAAAHSFVQPAPIEVAVASRRTARADFRLDDLLEVALVTRANRQADFDELFASRPDIAVTKYSGEELAEAAEHEVVVYGYEEYRPTDEEFRVFLDATDANGTGVIFLDQWFVGSGNGIRMLSAKTGQPASVGGRLASGASPSYYEVTAPHPVLAGFDVGERIPVDEVNGSPWISWFGGYEGDGRQSLADIGVTDAKGIYGHGIGVDQRANNRHALLASMSNNVLRSPEDWSSEATTVFWNSLDWVAPEPDPDAARFVEWDLRSTPGDVLAGERVSVSVDVTNVGASKGTRTLDLLIDGQVEDTEAVTLYPGNTRTVSWSVEREVLASYDVQVGSLTSRFVVRPPEVELTVRTLRAPGVHPRGMAGATVELLHEGELVPVGTTDPYGRLTFAAPVARAEYTLVVRRAATEEHLFAYLLQRPLDIDEDRSVVVAPRTLPGGWQPWDRSAVLDLVAEPAAEDRAPTTYVRGELTGSYGFAYQPGRLVATVGDYDVRHVHALRGGAREWHAVGEIQHVELSKPAIYARAFGGPARTSLSVTRGEGTAFTAEWSVVDGEGNPFELVASSQPRPFALPPATVVLEEVPALVAGDAPNEAELVLRLLDPGGTEVHAGGLAWAQRAVTRDLADLVDHVAPGTYSLSLEADLGAYPPGRLTATADFEVSPAVADPESEPASTPEPGPAPTGPQPDGDPGAEPAQEPPGPWTWRTPALLP